ncbi:3-dehydroquinate synthase [Candidatus Daviesbacteria bacterium]|nr:3-dehydroquinate synthase [Candidatus Daviesbacteria bacterium]
MQKIKLQINEKKKSYTIFIGTKIIKNIQSVINCAKYSNALIIADTNVPKKILKNLTTALPIKSSAISISGGDRHKSIESVQKIWKFFLESYCDRKSLTINIGGGTIGDIGGFTASTFMRGIDFLQIPTTLLAQVDASVGGKVGINFLSVKNLIGTLQQPIAVVIDIDTLSTLPQREFISAFAEIIKHGVVTNKKYFQFVTSKKPRDFSNDELVKIIKISCQIKADIVALDEKEEGPRKLLNFGHTIGHAVESLSLTTSNPLLHGEAVSIGMIIEGQISKRVGLLSDDDYDVLEQALIRAGLPTKSPNMQTRQILEKIKSDKKNEKGKINWTLLKSIGEAVYNQQVDEGVIRKIL